MLRTLGETRENMQEFPEQPDLSILLQLHDEFQMWDRREHLWF